MRRKVLQSIILLFAVFAIPATTANGVPKCTITKQLATQIKNQMGDELGEMKIRSEPVSNNCDELINRLINFSSQLRNKLKKEKSIEVAVSEKLQRFYQQDEVKNFNSTVNGVRGYFKTTYIKSFHDLNTTLSELDLDIAESLDKQLSMQIKLDFYSFMINHGDIDLDDNPRDTANSCEIGKEKAAKLFEIFNEIRKQVHIPTSQLCKDLIRQMINIRNLMNRVRKYERDRLISTDMILEQQHIIIKKFTNHINESRKDYDALGDDLAKVKAFKIEMQRNEKNLNEYISNRAYDFLGKSIREVKNINLLTDAIFDCEENGSYTNSLTKALSETYKCDKTSLKTIYNFLVKYNDPSKFNWLLNEMSQCNHLNELILLKVLKSSTTQQNYQSQIDAVYRDIGEKVRKNDSKVHEEMKEYKEFLNDEKILENCYDRNLTNLRSSQNFIENSDHRLFLEDVLTREFKLTEGVDLSRMLKFGFWLKSRLDNFSTDNEFKQKMMKLKVEKLTHVVQVICFGVFGLISAETNKPLITPSTPDPTRDFQNLFANYAETSEGIFLSFHYPKKPEFHLCIDKDGYIIFDKKTSSKQCLWKVELAPDRVDCTNCVTIVDTSNGKYLSSKYVKTCAETNWLGQCTKHQNYNKALLPSGRQPHYEKWKIN